MMILFTTLTGCSGCTYFFLNVESLENSKGSSSSTLNAPSSIILFNPTLQPASDPKPIFLVSGLSIQSGIKLNLYSDNDCKVKISDKEINSTSVEISPSQNLLNGEYLVSTNVTDSNLNKSSCVVADQKYILDLEPHQITSISPTEIINSVGGQIVISGNHFTQDTLIYIDDVLCDNIKFNSENNIECIIPPFSEGQHDLIVVKGKNPEEIIIKSVITVNPELPKAPLCTNGGVISFSNDANYVFYGGAFTRLGTCVGGGLPIDSKTGVVKNFSSGSYPKVAGSVLTSVPDGQGGLYIGGGFQSVGGVDRQNFAHILSDGTVDPIVGSNLEFNGAVSKIIYDNEDKKIYLGGGFTSAKLAHHSSGVFINQTSLNFKSNSLKIIGDVYSSISDGSGGFYIGGKLIWVDNLPVGNLIHVLIDGDGNQTLDMLFNPSPNEVVNAIILKNSSLYIGGKFSLVGGVSRNIFAKIDKFTGIVDNSFNANAVGYNVQTMALNGNKLFIGGAFTNMSGQVRNNLAAYNVDSDTLDTNFNPNPNDGIHNLITTGTFLYVNGSFTTIGGITRKFLAAVDTTSGNGISSFNPTHDLTQSSYSYLPITFSTSGTTLFVGGRFLMMGGLTRHYLAEINMFTGQATAFDLQIATAGYLQEVTTLFLNGNQLIFTGSFIKPILGKLRETYGVLDLQSFQLTNFNPIYAYGDIKTISADGTHIFIGGLFESFSSETQSHIAVIDAVSGALTNFKFEIGDSDTGYYSQVASLTKVNNNLYFSGTFNFVNNETRNNLAGVDLSAGTVLNFNPDVKLGASGIDLVKDFKIKDSLMYIGGRFDSVGGVTRNNFAVINLNSSLATDDFQQGTNGEVNAVEISNNYLALGGSFTQFENQTRDRIAVVDLTTNALSPLSLNGLTGDIYTFLFDNNKLYFGGDFKFISDSKTRNNLGVLNLTNGSLTNYNPNIGGIVLSIGIINNILYVGGDFTFISGQERLKLAAIDINTGNLADWKVDVDGYSIVSQLVSNGTLYIGGNFTSVGAFNHLNLAAIDIQQAQVSNSFQAEVDDEVRSIKFGNGKLYIGGPFKNVNTTLRNYVAALNPTTGSLLGFNADILYSISKFVSSIELSQDNSILYIGGYYSSISGLGSRARLSAVDATTGALRMSFVMSPDYRVYNLKREGNTLYVAGAFHNFNTVLDRQGLASIDLVSETLNSLSVEFDRGSSLTDIFSVFPLGNKLFLYGSFEIVAGQRRNSFALVDSTTGLLSNFNPIISNSETQLQIQVYAGAPPNALAVINNLLYIGGAQMSTFNKQPRSIGVVNVNTLESVSNW